MKRLSILLALAFAFTASAQNCAEMIQFNNGVSYTMTSYSPKDKVQSVATTTVSNVTKTGASVKADLTQVVKDEKGKETATMNSTISCDNGTFSVDMKSFVSPDMTKAYKDMDMKFEGNTLQYPGTLSTGQTLPDGTLKVEMSSKGTKSMEMNVKIYDRKVEGKESLTAAGRSFECYKISYMVDLSNAMVMPNGNLMNMPGIKPRKVVEWFCPTVGAVKTETYRNDKLEGYSLLTELSK